MICRRRSTLANLIRCRYEKNVKRCFYSFNISLLSWP